MAMAMIKTCSTPPIFVPKVSGPVCSFKALQALPLKNCEVAIDAWQEGSGDPSPSNVRPIHGFSVLNLYHRGKNLFDKTTVTYSKWIDNITGEIVDANARYCVSDYIPVNAGDVIHFPNKGNSRNGYFDKNKNALGYFSASNTTVTMAHGGFIVCSFDTNNVNLNDMQIEYGNVETPYKPYWGEDVLIDLDGTRYGGVLNVLTGEMAVTHQIIDMGSIYWIYKTEFANPYFQRDIPGRKNGTAITIPIYKYDGFKGATSAGTMSNYKCGVHQTSNPIYIRDDRYTSGEDFKAAMSGIPLMYELETPITVQLTPVQIDTILNTNNIFADTGDTTVQYIKIGG